MSRRDPRRDEVPALEDARFTDPSVPSKACCCPGRPVVKVVMPPAGGRAHPVDLWLCGHHFRISLPVLFAAGASVEDLTMTADSLRTEYAVSAIPRPRRRERA